jgi:hypothetical protein
MKIASQRVYKLLIIFYHMRLFTDTMTQSTFYKIQGGINVSKITKAGIILLKIKILILV